jgi:hypothetical protein
MAETNVPGACKTVWISTPPRTGSTWLFNVTREILRRAGCEVLPERVPIDDKVMYQLAQQAWADSDPSRIWVLKIHGTILRTDLPRSKIITCIRDPRDVLVSFRRFMDTSFEHALAISAAVKRYVEGYRNHPADLLLRLEYEDVESRPAEVLQRVATFLDVPVAAADELQILAMFGRERVRQRAADISEDLRQRLKTGAAVAADEVILRDQTIVRAFDVGTGFQTGHVSDSKSGDWRSLLSDDEKRMVHETFGDWFERHGYPPG